MAVLFQSTEKKGTFVLKGNVQEVIDGINAITQEYAEYNDGDFESQEAYDKFVDDEASLSDEQKEDLAKFRAYVNSEYDWKEAFDKIQRKANGTFAKNRVAILAQGHNFSWESEEEYGRRGPELRIKTYSDTEAQLEFYSSTIIEKY